MHKQWYYSCVFPLKASSGQTRRVVESCRALAKQREVQLIAPNAPPEELPNLTTHLMPVPQRPPREMLLQAQLFRKLPTYIKDPQQSVLLAVAAGFNLGLIIAAKRLGVPCLLELNGLPALEYGLERRDRTAKARALYYTLIAHLEGRLASGFIGVTPQLAEEAQRWGAHHTLVAPNAVNPQHFSPVAQQEARRSLGLANNEHIIGFVGNFAAWQGLDTLVQAVVSLISERPNLTLLLIGDGVERSRLESLATPYQDRVRFLGLLPHEQVGKALSACDILAAPMAMSERNRRTGVSPLKVFEYLALGRPIIVSRLPGMEFVEREGLGEVFTPGDSHELAATIQRVLDLSPEAKQTLGERARQAAETTHSWDRVMQDVINFGEHL